MKAGGTFRFKDNPTEYTLNGPVISKEKLRRIERDRKRDEERSVGHKKASPSDSEPSFEVEAHKESISIASFVAACVVMISMVWYFRKRRSAWKA